MDQLYSFTIVYLSLYTKVTDPNLHALWANFVAANLLLLTTTVNIGYWITYLEAYSYWNQHERNIMLIWSSLSGVNHVWGLDKFFNCVFFDNTAVVVKKVIKLKSA